MSEEFETKLRTIVRRFPPESRAQARRDVERLLGEGIDSVDACIATLQDESADIEVRRIACWLLGQLRDRRAAGPLLEALEARDPGLRWEAAKALGALRDERTVQSLIATLLEAGDVDKRAAAAYALGALGDERAVEPLIDVLSDPREDSRLRGQAAESIAYLRDDRAVAPLILALRDDSVEVRFWSAFALGSLGDARAVPELERLAATDDTVLPGWWAVKEEAAKAIEQIRDQGGNP